MMLSAPEVLSISHKMGWRLQTCFGIDQRFGSRRIGRQLIVRDALTLECRAAWKFEGSYRMWISKISSDLRGRIGEILKL
jgi:hypothetical protein